VAEISTCATLWSTISTLSFAHQSPLPKPSDRDGHTFPFWLGTQANLALTIVHIRRKILNSQVPRVGFARLNILPSGLVKSQGKSFRINSARGIFIIVAVLAGGVSPIMKLASPVTIRLVLSYLDQRTNCNNFANSFSPLCFCIPRSRAFE